MLTVIGVVYEILYVKLQLELSVLFLLEEAYCLSYIKYFVYHPMHHTAVTSYTDMVGIQVGAVSI